MHTAQYWNMWEGDSLIYQLKKKKLSNVQTYCRVETWPGPTSWHECGRMVVYKYCIPASGACWLNSLQLSRAGRAELYVLCSFHHKKNQPPPSPTFKQVWARGQNRTISLSILFSLWFVLQKMFCISLRNAMELSRDNWNRFALHPYILPSIGQL